MSVLAVFFGAAELLAPGFLALIAVLPVVAWLRWRRRRPAVRFAPAQFAVDLPHSTRSRLRVLAPAAQMTGLLLVGVALARPAERERLPEELRGIDIVLCIDTSSSMSAADLDGRRTRLAVARAAAARFVAARQSDRIGLVRFARFPDVSCPPTLDHAAVTRFLEELTTVTRDGLEDRTGIGTAVARAAEVLRESRSDSKVVVLLTDGEENVATAATPEEIGPMQAARMCEALGIRVYTIAVGVGRQDETGAVIPLDTRQVERLAEVTGGRFFAARDAEAVTAVYGSIDELETVPFEEPRYVFHDRFVPVLIAALALLVVGRFLEASVLRVSP